MSLVAEWLFDEGEGNIAHDTSGKGNHGTIHGATWGKGILGSALHFDGAAYVEILDADLSTSFPGKSVNGYTDAMSIATWIKWEGSAYNAIVHKFQNADGHRSWALGIGLNFNIGDGVNYAVASSGGIKTGTLHHVICTYDKSNITIYVDNTLLPSAKNPIACTYDIGRVADSIRIGQRSDGMYPFIGYIDNMRIYDHALSAIERTALYKELTKTVTFASIPIGAKVKIETPV